jgi:hypothetical protein
MVNYNVVFFCNWRQCNFFFLVFVFLSRLWLTGEMVATRSWMLCAIHESAQLFDWWTCNWVTGLWKRLFTTGLEINRRQGLFMKLRVFHFNFSCIDKCLFHFLGLVPKILWHCSRCVAIATILFIRLRTNGRRWRLLWWRFCKRQCYCESPQETTGAAVVFYNYFMRVIFFNSRFVGFFGRFFMFTLQKKFLR